MNDAERDELLIRVDTRVEAIHTTTQDQETRIRSLEKSSNLLAGAVAVLASLKAYFLTGSN